MLAAEAAARARNDGYPSNKRPSGHDNRVYSIAMRIAVLVKQIPQVEELELGPDGRLLRDGVPLEMNAYCRRAVAKGAHLARETNGTCTVVTLGPPQAEQVLVEALTWGADAAVHVCDLAFAGSDTLATARSLARALTITGPFDLILVGRNSLDADTGQVGPAVAEILGLPFMSAVRELDLDGRTVKVRCETDDGWLRAEIDLPAVLSCAERLCDPAKVPDATWTSELRQRLRLLTAADLGTGSWGVEGSATSVGEVRLLSSHRRPHKLAGPIAKQVTAAIELLGHPEELPAVQPLDGRVVVDGTVAVIVEPGRPRIAQELLGAARRLSRSVVAVTVAGSGEAIPPGEVVAAVGDWCVREEPWAVLAPSTLWGRELSARVAARLGAGLVGDAVDLEVVDGRLVAWKPACAGRLLAAIRASSKTQMVTVRPGVFSPSGYSATDVSTYEVVSASTGVVRVVDSMRDDELDALATATAVLGVGKGVQPSEYGALAELARVLGAQLAASRRVTDAGWLPHSRQVGITGRSIAPRLYVAIGVSGKPNHMLGVRGAGRILAINSDGSAPVFDVADVGIVADWREAVPLLTDALAGSAWSVGELDDRVDFDARTAGQR